MSTSRTRIARFTASAALVLGFGALGAGPALATGAWAGSTVDSAITFASEDGFTMGTAQLDKARSTEDGATNIIILGQDYNDDTDGRGYWLV